MYCLKISASQQYVYIEAQKHIFIPDSVPVSAAGSNQLTNNKHLDVIFPIQCDPPRQQRDVYLLVFFT